MYASTGPTRMKGSQSVLPKPKFENGILRIKESKTNFPVINYCALLKFI